MSRPERYAVAEDLADVLIERLGGRIRLAVPLGLGKPTLLVNALYERARQCPEVELDLFTALTLEVPRSRSDLEHRFLAPLVERLYAGVPELAYAADLRRGTLPVNVRVHEFYLRPGAWLGVDAVQRSYVSSNYTHVARDTAGRGINVIAQMVAPATATGDPDYSLSCNPDITLDLLDALTGGQMPKPLIVGEVNQSLPYLYGAAQVDADFFDLLLEDETIEYDLFPVPNRPVGLTEQVIGLRVAALVRDGGTLQIGIGGLGDAVAASLVMRRTDNARFRALVAALNMDAPAPELDDLPEGLYGCSEMFVEGFLHLREQGVLCRTVDDGVFLHAGFLLGSASFYQRLRDLNEEERRGIDMSRISFINQLYGDEARKREQRRGARFVNTTMMMTLLGAAVSDALEDGRVVSGVGGQYNFVAMAHELKEGRSVLVLPATRTAKGRLSSNLVWNYAHVTIPRHLRDLVVTEYGVADLRGRSDQEVIVALLNVADSRFQEGLRREAVASGKLSKTHRIPMCHRSNLPESLQTKLAASELLDALPWFPLGSDFTQTEAELAVALEALDDLNGRWWGLAGVALAGLRGDSSRRLDRALVRMGLAKPGGLRERLYKLLLAGALVREGHEGGRPLFRTSQAEGVPGDA